VIKVETGHLCLPADFKSGTLLRFSDLNKKYNDMKIAEVYGNLTNTPYGSGRGSKSLKECDIELLKSYVSDCKKNRIEFNYTFNAATFSNREFTKTGQEDMLRFIKQLKNIGVNTFTISLPSVISLISNEYPDTKIIMSAVTCISTPYQLKELADDAKISRAYVVEDMNRKPNALKKMAEQSPFPLSTIVNGFCLFMCAYRNMHYTSISFRNSKDQVEMPSYYDARCSRIKIDNPEEIIKIPFIRPNDIGRYKQMGINWFKIAGREMINANPNFAESAEAYMGGSYDGDLIDLLMNFSDKKYRGILSLNSKSLDPYFEKLFERGRDCDRSFCGACGLCRTWAKYVKVDQKRSRSIPRFRPLKYIR